MAMTDDVRTPYQKRRDALARILAASVMGLVKDATGSGLPDDCWQTMAPKADAILFIVSDQDRNNAGKELEHNQGAYHGPG